MNKTVRVVILHDHEVFSVTIFRVNSIQTTIISAVRAKQIMTICKGKEWRTQANILHETTDHPVIAVQFVNPDPF